MRSASRSRSLLRTAGWVFLGPFVAIGGLALGVLGFAVLAVVAQLIVAFLRYAGA